VYLHQLTERVVPGGDDEHHTEGLRHDLRRGRERSYGRRYLLGLHPVLEPVERELARGLRQRYLGHENMWLLSVNPYRVSESG